MTVELVTFQKYTISKVICIFKIILWFFWKYMEVFFVFKKMKNNELSFK